MFGFSKKAEKNETTTPGIQGVKHVIAIASGKGGVGKSTVTTNLALALQKLGYKVGLMDADIYGPSQPGMLGGQEYPKSENNFIKPIEKYGIKFISMGSIQKEGAVVMRAPMAVKAMSQFLTHVLWGDLDFLLIDLPPGTGDLQLSLAQQAELAGAVIVTTPQRVAVEIARKGQQMFDTVSVPIVGIVENMSGYTCTHCQQTTAVFKDGGGARLAQETDTPFLGGIPLDPMIMMSGDDGIPIVQKDPNSVPAQAFSKVAQNLLKNLEQVQEKVKKISPKSIKLHEKDGHLEIHWNDDCVSHYDAFNLRLLCPCASCVDENSGKRIITAEQIPVGILIKSARGVGRYGLSLQFSDGHGTGIFKFTKLREWHKDHNSTDTLSV